MPYACDGQEAAAVEHERGLEWLLRRCGRCGASGRLLALALLRAEPFHVGRLGRWDGWSRDEAHRGSRGKAAEVEREEVTAARVGPCGDGRWE